MHELSVAEGLLQIVRDALKERPESKLTAVAVRIGVLSGIETEALSFCFSALIKETPFEGAALQITSVPVTGHCTSCSREWTIEEMTFLCPECRSLLAIDGGRELEITHVEVE